MGCIRVLYLAYDLILRIKDSRYKYTIENFTYTHYNQAKGKQSQIYGMKDQGDCKSKGDLEGLLAGARCKKEFSNFYNYLGTDMTELVAKMNKKIDKKSDDDF